MWDRNIPTHNWKLGLTFDHRFELLGPFFTCISLPSNIIFRDFWSGKLWLSPEAIITLAGVVLGLPPIIFLACRCIIGRSTVTKDKSYLPIAESVYTQRPLTPIQTSESNLALDLNVADCPTMYDAIVIGEFWGSIQSAKVLPHIGGWSKVLL